MKQANPDTLACGKEDKKLFETIRIQNRQLRNIGFHNGRFNRSRFEMFGIHEPLALEEIIIIPDNLDDQIYKCRLVYSKTAEKIEFEAYLPKTITSLKIIECNDIDYSYKYFDRGKINELFAQRGSCDDILIVKDGLVTDTSFANVVFWDGSDWITPSSPLLHGTKRQQLLNTGRIREQVITAEDISLYRSARIINAMTDLEESKEIKEIYDLQGNQLLKR